MDHIKQPGGWQTFKHQGSQSFELLPALQKKYSRYLRPEIISLRMVIPDFHNTCMLIIRTLNDKAISEEIICLDMLGKMFSIKKSLNVLVKNLLEELNEYDLIMCTSLFTLEACQQIALIYESDPF